MTDRARTPAKAAKPQVLRSLPALRRWRAALTDKRESLALVPTMGALHEGHLALVRAARKKADRVIVSIFVNPAQFAPHEDFGSYPRTFAADLEKLASVGADAVWAPTAAVMYPEGFAVRIEPAGAAKAGLEDKFRPHFFGGVCTVVAKLLLQTEPDVAMFGEKDYQQLQVVTAMARDLDIPTRIIGLPTVREKDGLALSSRNAYLSADERAVAPTLHRTLAECATAIRAGKAAKVALREGVRRIERAGFTVDYLEARDARTLAPPGAKPRGAKSLGAIRLLVAARLGRTRLIDNLGVKV